jgi:hypothetical protein
MTSGRASPRHLACQGRSYLQPLKHAVYYFINAKEKQESLTCLRAAIYGAEGLQEVVLSCFAPFGHTRPLFLSSWKRRRALSGTEAAPPNGRYRSRRRAIFHLVLTPAIGNTVSSFLPSSHRCPPQSLSTLPHFSCGRGADVRRVKPC